MKLSEVIAELAKRLKHGNEEVVISHPVEGSHDLVRVPIVYIASDIERNVTCIYCDRPE